MSKEFADLRHTDYQKWLATRATGIGSSDAAVILDLNPYKSRYALWAEKTGLVDPPDLSQNESVEWGIKLEDPIAQKWSRVRDMAIVDHGRHAVRRSEKYPWMLATIDREILPKNGRGPGILEIKTTGAAHEGEWEEDAPIAYQAQLIHQMVVWGYTWGSLAVLIGGQRFKYIDIPFHPEFAALLIEEERKFWDMVEREIAPDPDEKPSTREAIERMFPKDIGKTIELPGELMEWANKRRDLKAQIKALEDEIARAENHIKLALGDATQGLWSDGTGFSWRVQRRAEHVVPAAEFRVLREIKPRSKS